MDEYARFATLYDPLIGPFLRPIHRKIQATLVRQSCSTMVDLCCGTGLLAGMTAEANIRATGVDISKPMLNIARTNHPNATFIHGDAADTAFRNNEFDAVAISFSLHEKPASIAKAILAEGLRIIRPGGLILVADYRHPTRRHSRLTGWGIQTIERLAGKEHFTHFNHFMAQGGTEAFLTQDGLKGKPTATFMHGWVGLFTHVCQ